MANAGVANQNIHIADNGKGLFYSIAVGNITADSAGTGFFCHSQRGFCIFFVKKEYAVASLGEQLHRCGTDTSGATGDYNS